MIPSELLLLRVQLQQPNVPHVWLQWLSEMESHCLLVTDICSFKVNEPVTNKPWVRDRCCFEMAIGCWNLLLFGSPDDEHEKQFNVLLNTRLFLLQGSHSVGRWQCQDLCRMVWPHMCSFHLFCESLLLFCVVPQVLCILLFTLICSFEGILLFTLICSFEATLHCQSAPFVSWFSPPCIASKRALDDRGNEDGRTRGDLVFMSEQESCSLHLTFNYQIMFTALRFWHDNHELDSTPTAYLTGALTVYWHKINAASPTYSSFLDIADRQTNSEG